MPEEGTEGQKPSEGQKPAAPEPAKTESKEVVKETTHFDAGYVKELRAEAAKNRKEAQEAKARIEEFENQNKSDAEKLAAKAESASSKAKELEATNVKLRVALAKKLPMELIDRLKGNSQEEIEADADELLKLVKSNEKSTSMDGGTREPAPEPKTPEQAHNAAVLKVLGVETTSP